MITDGITHYNPINSPLIYEPPISLGYAFIAPGVRMCAHTYINSGRICSESYIGRYCSIGNDVTIGTGHHNADLLSTSSWFDSNALPTFKFADNKSVKVRIKNDVWIGDKAIIMSGVTVGNGAVIGAGAVVTKDVPDYAVVIGVPAKILKYRFDEHTIERLLRSRWWEFDDQLLKSHILNNIEDSLEFLETLTDENRISETLKRL